MSYATNEAHHQIPLTIHNENFVEGNILCNFWAEWLKAASHALCRFLAKYNMLVGYVHF